MDILVAYLIRRNELEEILLDMSLQGTQLSIQCPFFILKTVSYTNNFLLLLGPSGLHLHLTLTDRTIWLCPRKLDLQWWIDNRPVFLKIKIQLKTTFLMKSWFTPNFSGITWLQLAIWRLLIMEKILLPWGSYFRRPRPSEINNTYLPLPRIGVLLTVSQGKALWTGWIRLDDIVKGTRCLWIISPHIHFLCFYFFPKFAYKWRNIPIPVCALFYSSSHHPSQNPWIIHNEKSSNKAGMK